MVSVTCLLYNKEYVYIHITYLSSSLPTQHPVIRGTPAVSQSLSGWRWCTHPLLLISVSLWRLSAGWVRSSSTPVRLDFITHNTCVCELLYCVSLLLLGNQGNQVPLVIGQLMWCDMGAHIRVPADTRSRMWEVSFSQNSLCVGAPERLYLMFQMVWGGSCVRWACRKLPRGRTPHWSTSWCSTIPRCGKVGTYTHTYLVYCVCA